MVVNIILLLLGFVILILCSDIFVDAISSIATHFRMPKMLIALTVAAFGTCAPELAISFNSVMSGNGDIALANVVGSNVVNILLIIGVAAFCFPIKVKDATVKKELPLVLLTTTVFALAMITHYLSPIDEFILTRTDALLFILFFIVFLVHIFSIVKVKPKLFESRKPEYSMKSSIVLSIVCLVGIIIASDIVVDNAVSLAELAKVSNKIITMTIVVIGTSLPELTMTVIAAKKKEFDISIGNIIGTNIFNIGVVLGLPVLIFGGFSSPSFNLVDVLAVEIAVILYYFFSRNDRVISRKEGVTMVLIFALYYAYILFL